jgi:hypothetical protein
MCQECVTTKEHKRAVRELRRTVLRARRCQKFAQANPTDKDLWSDYRELVDRLAARALVHGNFTKPNDLESEYRSTAKTLIQRATEKINSRLEYKGISGEGDADGAKSTGEKG